MKKTLFTIAMLAICVGGLIAVNSYVLNITHGCYNAFDVLFM